MLNEKRVKHMTKLAFYESKEGAEEIQIDAIPKKQYIFKNVVQSLLWMTFAYAVVAVFIYQAFASYLFTNTTEQSAVMLLVFLGIGYACLAIVYGIKATYHYKRKHRNAHYNVKAFRKELDELERMYEEETTHG